MKLSVSSIKTYEQCPRKWYFTYVLRQPRKEWPHLELGKFVHDVLEKFHNRASDDPEEWPGLMAEICNSSVSEFNLSPEHRVLSQEMLATYLAVLKEHGMPNVMANEQDFYIHLEDDLVIRGYIDRIDRSDKGYIVQDYKAGKSAYLDEFQLLVYGLYLLEQDPNLEKYKGAYIMLKEGSKEIPYTFTRTDLDRVVQKIRNIAKEIRADKTWDPRPSFLCNYCDFEDICPATQREEEWSQKSSFQKDK